MTKKEILAKTGLSEKEFYKLYPTREAYEMKFGGLIETYPTQPTGDQIFNYGRSANIGIPLMSDGGVYSSQGTADQFFNFGKPAPEMAFYRQGGQPCFECGGQTKRLKRRQMGGAPEEAMMGNDQQMLVQIIEAYAEMSGQPPQEIITLLENMNPDDQQMAISQMAEAVQGSQQNMMAQPSMEQMQPMMQSGGEADSPTRKRVSDFANWLKNTAFDAAMTEEDGYLMKQGGKLKKAQPGGIRNWFGDNQYNPPEPAAAPALVYNPNYYIPEGTGVLKNDPFYESNTETLRRLNLDRSYNDLIERKKSAASNLMKNAANRFIPSSESSTTTTTGSKSKSAKSSTTTTPTTTTTTTQASSPEQSAKSAAESSSGIRVVGDTTNKTNTQTSTNTNRGTNTQVVGSPQGSDFWTQLGNWLGTYTPYAKLRWRGQGSPDFSQLPPFNQRTLSGNYFGYPGEYNIRYNPDGSLRRVRASIPYGSPAASWKAAAPSGNYTGQSSVAPTTTSVPSPAQPRTRSTAQRLRNDNRAMKDFMKEYGLNPKNKDDRNMVAWNEEEGYHLVDYRYGGSKKKLRKAQYMGQVNPLEPVNFQTSPLDYSFLDTSRMRDDDYISGKQGAEQYLEEMKGAAPGRFDVNAGNRWTPNPETILAGLAFATNVGNQMDYARQEEALRRKMVNPEYFAAVQDSRNRGDYGDISQAYGMLRPDQYNYAGPYAFAQLGGPIPSGPMYLTQEMIDALNTMGGQFEY